MFYQSNIRRPLRLLTNDLYNFYGGETVGDTVGGLTVGDTVGLTVGDTVGLTVGDTVGLTVGDTVGGLAVGAPVGALVGAAELPGAAVGTGVPAGLTTLCANTAFGRFTDNTTGAAHAALSMPRLDGSLTFCSTVSAAFSSSSTRF